MQYSANSMRGADWNAVPQKVQYVGNSVKSMTISLEASLKKLRTHYVDIFYVHFVSSPYFSAADEHADSDRARTVGLGDVHRGDHDRLAQPRRLGQSPLSGSFRAMSCLDLH